MNRRTGSRLATVLAATALAAGVSQAPAGATPWPVDGVSTSGCVEADGQYEYEKTGEPDRYTASYWISVSTTGRCSGSVGGHLRIRYKEWLGSFWETHDWETIASTRGDGVGSDTLIEVKDVRFLVCDSTASRPNYNCSYVS
ncbi:hypothetical protein [Streptomyces sp. S.PNR 29]|uniref:hypothetical protein n=1 Tax=Streptomyces sp. S.PNR 29 TaxID=2973805 RepID=UPI0025AFD498|nr:hypothetical protein [Streptomyces sp. S.PNR 29]MDN0198481.1 hypothetical protein [Streptomyces sp. S.PNR 29]